MRRPRRQHQTRANRIRLKTKMTIIEVKQPRNLNDVALALETLGVGVSGQYPAASNDFQGAADLIRRALANIEITGDLI